MTGGRDDYWESESIPNEAVAEWFGKQPESTRQPVQTAGAGAPDTHITEDMVLLAARAIAATSFTNEFGESKNKHIVLARAALAAALAGRAVVELPEPNSDESYEGDPIWTNRNGDYVFAYHDSVVGPIVDLSNGERVGPDSAEEDAAILLAAARVARRLSGGSQVGDQ